MIWLNSNLSLELLLSYVCVYVCVLVSFLYPQSERSETGGDHVLLAFPSIRPSVCEHRVQSGKIEVRFEPATFRVGGQRDNHYAMETYCTMPFEGLKCMPSNERAETK